MRVVFITLYDVFCRGARELMSNLLAHGHDAHLIQFKDFRPRDFHYRNPDEVRERDWIMKESGHLPVLEFHVDFDRMCPYPTPVTEREKELLVERIREVGADAIGFSVNSTFLPLARNLSVLLRERFPGTPILWGGVHCILRPEDAIGYADVICNSEADECLMEWADNPSRTDIEGFWFCQDGEVIRNPVAPLPQDLDRVPFPSYGDLEREVLIEDNEIRSNPPVHYGFYILLSQRGCPFQCTYCLHSKTREIFKGKGSYLRRKSVDRVLDEVEQIVHCFGFEAVAFMDDIFMIDREWIDEFCEKHRKRLPGFPFGAYGHSAFTTPDMLKKLQEAGCFFTSLGIQSGSPYVIEKVYHRKESPESMVRFAGDILDAGIGMLTYDILTNSVFEREEDLHETLELLYRLPRAVNYAIKKITPYPGTVYPDLDLPHGGVSEEIFRFYSLLFTLALEAQADPEWIRGIEKSEYYRSRLNELEAMVRSYVSVSGELNKAKERIGHLEAELQHEKTLRPWGIRGAMKVLVRAVERKMAGIFKGASRGQAAPQSRERR